MLSLQGRRQIGLMGMILMTLLPFEVSGEDAVQALAKTELVIESNDRIFTFQVEVAKSPEERRIGLMNRDYLAPDHGMLFDFGRTAPVAMWMKNTYIPLDMLFIRANGEIVNIAENTVPHSEDILSSDGPVQAVLEVPGGTSRLLGLKPGDRVLHAALGKTSP